LLRGVLRRAAGVDFPVTGFDRFVGGRTGRTLAACALAIFAAGIFLNVTMNS